MMNVLILIKNSLLSGVVTNAVNLADGLTRHMNDNVFFASSSGEGTDSIKDYHVDILDFDVKTPFGIIKTYKKLSKIIKANKIDIIHAQNRIPAIYASVYCSFHKLNYIWANHLVPLSGNLKSRLLTKYGYCAVAEGFAGKKMLEETLRIPDSRIRIINLGIDLSKFIKTTIDEQFKLKKEYGIGESEKVILLYGRLCDNKGHLFLLDALSKVKYKNYKLIFPGNDDNFKEIVDRRAEEYGIHERIVYPGYVDGRECLSICDLMVLPSKYEGFPQACVEAYAMGVPVIRSTSGGYEDTADMCFGVDYGDVDRFAYYLNDFFEHPQIYIERADIAKKLVQRLSIEEMAMEYHHLYQEAVNEKK